MRDLRQLAVLAGIEVSYHDVWGVRHDVSDETLQSLLNTLGFTVATDEEKQRAEAAMLAEKEPLLPQVKLLALEQAGNIHLPGASGWSLHGEDDRIITGTAVHDYIHLPPLPMGYYVLKADVAGAILECTVIVAPSTCWLPEDIKKGKRNWGIAAQLYALRSERNWGQGDFGDLRLLVEKAAALGAGVIGLNPLHALFPSNPEHYAPYTPSNRLFLNPYYIDIESVGGFTQCAEAQELVNSPEFLSQRDAARGSELVDYPLVAKLKQDALAALFRDFQTREMPPTFTRFCEDGGELLRAQAVFDALCEHFHAQHAGFAPWQNWPPQYQSMTSEEVGSFTRDHAEKVQYYMWLQWLADTQMGRLQEIALERGMSIGLYRDLAVGSDKAGAEVWMNPEAFLHRISVGAPPDEYNPQGQNWALPALNPLALKKTGYTLFRSLLRANMRNARALRIDHAFGLCRLYLIPEGKNATDGAYLTYAFEDMLAVIKLESHRNRCMVIGEDLGTFPPHYRHGALEAGLLSYNLFYFEHEPDGRFTPPDRYPALSLATLSTHDLPTYQGWLKSADIEERARLKLYPNEKLLESDRVNRPADIERLTQALIREGLHEVGGATPSITQVQAFLARTPSALAMVQLEDAIGVTTQMNLPGTTKERQNWRLKLPETIERMTAEGGPLGDIAAVMNPERKKRLLHVPKATYRLQFHKEFTFHDAITIIPYLASLGISHIYASPYFSARPGSQHGYDITDHNTINAELGGEEGFAAFLEALQANGLGHILDFVPNHMGVGGSDNAWWLNVLEWGENSPYADYFDIDWSPRYPGAATKLIVPFLGDHYGDILAKGELTLKFDAHYGSFNVWYGPHCFPVCPKDYLVILPGIGEAVTVADGEAIKHKLAENGALHAEIEQKTDAINLDRHQLHALLERQYYRLAYWRVASTDINYRRFFDITDLAGIRPENPELFNAMHKRVFSLIGSGKLQGLRIDHIDGLSDPAEYCRRLRQSTGSATYLIVEKILAEQENLPETWDINGTSGYDVLNVISDIFVERKNEGAIDKLYHRFTGMTQSFTEMIFATKTLILETTLASELQALSFLAKRIAERDIYTRDYTMDTLKQAIKDIIAYFPVYRTYITVSGADSSDIRIIDWAVARAKKRSFLSEVTVYDFVTSLLKVERGEHDKRTLTFMRKFQQLSGPVMAKGVEDTGFYRYNRLISLNEVGGNPAQFGITLASFHKIQMKRAEHWPHSMIATATHDTKRGEDMRMRIHTLSERPREWAAMLLRWARFNRSRRKEIEGITAPSRNDEYFIYQTLLGSWPMELLESPLDNAALQAYARRVADYCVKAMREAKSITSWGHPDEGYESAVVDFVHAILNGGKPSLFLDDIVREAKTTAIAGVVNSLAQTAIKLTIPGVPDIYQGTEGWDLSLVDPDNRRKVDYLLRQQHIDLQGTLPELLNNWRRGAVKQLLIKTLLAHRNQFPELYLYGSYVPLVVEGRHAGRVLAYARDYENSRLIVIVPVACHQVNGDIPLGDVWGDTTVAISTATEGERLSLTSLLNGSQCRGAIIKVADAFSDFPVALYYAAV